MRSKEKGIHVEGGEPSDLEIKKTALRKGVTNEELIFFFSYRGVASWRQGDPDRAHHPNDPLKEISTYIENSKRRLRLDAIKFELKDFFDLYNLKMGKEFDYKQTRYEDIAPYKGGHYIQRLSLKIDFAREVNILNVLEKMINMYDRVLILYGSGHYLKHRPVIKDIFKDFKVVKILD